MDTETSDDDGDVPLRTFPARHVPRLAVLVLLSLLSLQALGLKIMYLPLNRLIENRLCRDYYATINPSVIPPSGIVPEQLCKVDLVQQQLASLFGTVESLHLFIDLAVALPYGIVSDRGYRRLVLILNFVGFIAMYAWLFGFGYFTASLSPKVMLFGPILSIIGGGECVFMSTVSAMVTDIVTTDIQRTNMFAYISSIQYVIHLISPSIAAITMSRSLWLPFVIGLLLLIIATPLVGQLPKSLSSSYTALNQEDASLLDDESDSGPSSKIHDARRQTMRDIRDKITTLWKHMSGRRNFQLLLSIFFVAALASSNSPLFPQYISKRYDWTFANAGYLLSIKAAVNIMLLALIVPFAVKWLSTRLDFESGHINKLGGQIMLAISIAGAVLIAISPTVPYLIFAFFVYALGSALPVFTLSLVKDPAVAGIDTQVNAMDYSITMIAKYAGNMVGLPLMTILWAKGIGYGGPALGLPYFASAIFYAIGASFLSAMKPTG